MISLRFRIKIYLAVFLSVMILGTFGFMIVENLSLINAFYFCIVTISTVGYGDIHPATQLGRFLAIFLIIMGVGTFLGVIATASEMMLTKREKQARIKKLNIVVGLFFSELGMELIKYFLNVDPNINKIEDEVKIKENITRENFLHIKKHFTNYEYEIDSNKVDFKCVKKMLSDNKELLLRLLENPSLLEHESFTELIRAIFHLYEELVSRLEQNNLEESDITHLVGDMKRVYQSLIVQWIDYLIYLKDIYPYLYKYLIRMNPFNEVTQPFEK